MSKIPAACSVCYATQALPWLIGLYAIASLGHFAHNAEFLADYPNLPPSLTQAGIYGAWCGMVVVGVLAYVLYRRGYRRLGLAALALYALAGFGGLLHYTRAPMARHTSTMNGTILTEVAAAALLLIDVIGLAVLNGGRRR